MRVKRVGKTRFNLSKKAPAFKDKSGGQGKFFVSGGGKPYLD